MNICQKCNKEINPADFPDFISEHARNNAKFCARCAMRLMLEMCDELEPEIGDESLCTMCREEIYYNGKHWTHKEISPRHPALPISLADEFLPMT